MLRLKDKEERVSQAEGSEYTKAGAERVHGALRKLNLLFKIIKVLSLRKLVQRSALKSGRLALQIC